jgi:hypothetical protein
MLGLSNDQLHQSKSRRMKRAVRGKAALVMAAPTRMQREELSFSDEGADDGTRRGIRRDLSA